VNLDFIFLGAPLHCAPACGEDDGKSQIHHGGACRQARPVSGSFAENAIFLNSLVTFLLIRALPTVRQNKGNQR
jgi:hypothetical protein